MNREILFRGKRVDNGEWVYGYYLPWHAVTDLQGKEPYAQIFEEHKVKGKYVAKGWVRVKFNTVGQYTGLTDKNGNMIFEGDIIHIKCGYGFSAFVGKGIVFFDEKRLQFRVKSVKPSSFDSEKGNVYDECDFMVIDSYEVIGNIYDNPELLEVEK